MRTERMSGAEGFVTTLAGERNSLNVSFHVSLYVTFQFEVPPTDSTGESSIGTFSNFLADFGIDFSDSQIRIDNY